MCASELSLVIFLEKVFLHYRPVTGMYRPFPSETRSVIKYLLTAAYHCRRSRLNRRSCSVPRHAGSPSVAGLGLPGRCLADLVPKAARPHLPFPFRTHLGDSKALNVGEIQPWSSVRDTGWHFSDENRKGSVVKA